MAQEFGRLLRLYRERADMTKAELADKVGVSATYIYAQEAGRSTPGNYTFCEKVSSKLGLNSEEKTKLLELAYSERTKVKNRDFAHKLDKDYVDIMPSKISEDSAKYGESLIFFDIHDDKMAPEFRPGDMAMIHPYTNPEVGDYILIKSNKKSLLGQLIENNILFRQNADNIVINNSTDHVVGKVCGLYRKYK